MKQSTEESIHIKLYKNYLLKIALMMDKLSTEDSIDDE